MKITLPLAIVLIGLTSAEPNGESILEKFQYGIELVRRLLSKHSSFGTLFDDSQETVPEQDFASNLFTTILKAVVGNRKEIPNLGVKIAIFVAKMISDAFVPEGRTYRGRRSNDDFSPWKALMQVSEIRDLLERATDPKLMENVQEDFGDRGECFRLLLCKLSPIVGGMQRSLDFFLDFHENGTRGGVEECTKDECLFWTKSKPIDRFYFFLPNRETFLRNGDACKEKHSLCVY